MSASRLSRRRGPLVVVAMVAVVLVAVPTLSPRTLVAPVRGAVMRGIDVIAAPVLGHIPYTDLERVFNTAMFVPLGAVLAVVLGRRWWPFAMGLGAALSTAVEYAQTAIPGRVPDPEDIVWNTCGAIAGVLAVVLIRATWSGISRLARSARKLDAHGEAAVVTGRQGQRAPVRAHDRRDDRQPQA